MRQGSWQSASRRLSTAIPCRSAWEANWGSAHETEYCDWLKHGAGNNRLSAWRRCHSLAYSLAISRLLIRSIGLFPPRLAVCISVPSAQLENCLLLQWLTVLSLYNTNCTSVRSYFLLWRPSLILSRLTVLKNCQNLTTCPTKWRSKSKRVADLNRFFPKKGGSCMWPPLGGIFVSDRPIFVYLWKMQQNIRVQIPAIHYFEFFTDYHSYWSALRLWSVGNHR